MSQGTNVTSGPHHTHFGLAVGANWTSIFVAKSWNNVKVITSFMLIVLCTVKGLKQYALCKDQHEKKEKLLKRNDRQNETICLSRTWECYRSENVLGWTLPSALSVWIWEAHSAVLTPFSQFAVLYVHNIAVLCDVMLLPNILFSMNSFHLCWWYIVCDNLWNNSWHQRQNV